MYNDVLVFVSGLIHAWFYARADEYVHLSVAQQYTSLAVWWFGYATKKKRKLTWQRPRLAVLLGLASLMATLLPQVVISRGWMTYSMTTFTRLSSMFFSLALFRRHISTRQSVAGVMMIIAQMATLYGSKMPSLPQLGLGLCLSLFAALGTSLCGYIQTYYTAPHFQPYSGDALLAQSIDLLGVVAYHRVLVPYKATWFILLLYAVRMWFINNLFGAKEHPGMYLGLLLVLRKIITVAIGVTWDQLVHPWIYALGITLAMGSIVLFKRK